MLVVLPVHGGLVRWPCALWACGGAACDGVALCTVGWLGCPVRCGHVVGLRPVIHRRNTVV